MLVISFYEAVAPAVQQPAQQAPGAVVPKSQPQQQTQPAQVPAQPATTAQQPVANAGQTAAVQPAQTQPIQSTEPDWKKYLKYAAIAGGAIGGGALLHDIYHNGGLSNWWDNRIGGALSNIHFSPGHFFGSSGEDAPEESDNNSEVSASMRHAARRIPRDVPEDIVRPNWSAGYKGPPPLEHQPLRNGNYREVWPQPGHSPKQLNPYTQRQYYANRGGWWGGSSDDTIYSVDDDSSTYGMRTRPIRQPITDYDLARRSGMGN